MNDKEINEMAEEHWEYTKGILDIIANGNTENIAFELTRYLYIEAFKHGYKHGSDGIPKKYKVTTRKD